MSSAATQIRPSLLYTLGSVRSIPRWASKHGTVAGADARRVGGHPGPGSLVDTDGGQGSVGAGAGREPLVAVTLYPLCPRADDFGIASLDNKPLVERDISSLNHLKCRCRGFS